MSGKKCTQCGKFRYYDDFSKRTSSKDGYQSHCKICASVYHEIYKREGRVPKPKKSNHEAIFKAKHGVSPGTVRSYVNKNYTFLWGELTEKEKLSMIEEYKIFRNRDRVTTWYKRTLK